MLHLVTGSLVFLEVIKCRFPERGGCFWSILLSVSLHFSPSEQPDWQREPADSLSSTGSFSERDPPEGHKAALNMSEHSQK